MLHVHLSHLTLATSNIGRMRICICKDVTTADLASYPGRDAQRAAAAIQVCSSSCSHHDRLLTHALEANEAR